MHLEALAELSLSLCVTRREVMSACPSRTAGSSLLFQPRWRRANIRQLSTVESASFVPIFQGHAPQRASDFTIPRKASLLRACLGKFNEIGIGLHGTPSMRDRTVIRSTRFALGQFLITKFRG